MEVVQVSPLAWDAMLEHAREEAPKECCGLLIGFDGVVESSVRARNVHDSRTRYLIDPADHFAAIRFARATGRRVIGAYHSHPQSPPIPSPTDLSEANDVELLYVIVSLADAMAPDVRGYRFDGGTFTAVALVRIE